MCFRRSRDWEERYEVRRDERLWDLFQRETERSEPPIPVAEREDERERDRDRDEVPAGTAR
jgi:hypothetical protein